LKNRENEKEIFMSGVLVFCQSDKGKLVKVSLSALEAARALAKGVPIHAVLLGEQSKAAASELAGFGLAGIHVSESSEFSSFRSVVYAEVLARLSNSLSCTTVVVAASSAGKDLAPRVAYLLDAAQASDIVAVLPDGACVRPMYAGDLLAEVELLTEKKVFTVRASAFPQAASLGSGANAAQEIPAALLDQLPLALAGEVVDTQVSASARPELADAKVVVSGGRALGSAENFEKILFPLADALGAAVGASRAAVDSGYAPNDWQVGQTGKIVAPQLYIAVGVSGAIQHLAGMKDSKVIVAINKDAEAPIFEVADYGLVADLFQVLPELTEAIKNS
jgi:electron transfer flavoprotein alpha subunit